MSPSTAPTRATTAPSRSARTTSATDDPAMPDFVDHFAYQDGLLINYWDTSQTNNQTRLHPGKGLLLPIDAHFATLYRVDGVRLAQPHPDLRQHLHAGSDGRHRQHPSGGSVLSPVPSLPAVKAFDDRTLYYDPDQPAGQRDEPEHRNADPTSAPSALWTASCRSRCAPRSRSGARRLLPNGPHLTCSLATRPPESSGGLVLCLPCHHPRAGSQDQ